MPKHRSERRQAAIRWQSNGKRLEPANFWTEKFGEEIYLARKSKKTQKDLLVTETHAIFANRTMDVFHSKRDWGVPDRGLSSSWQPFFSFMERFWAQIMVFTFASSFHNRFDFSFPLRTLTIHIEDGSLQNKRKRLSINIIKPKLVIKKQITIIKIILSTNYHNYRN